jgi:hypothetical protein
VRVNGIALMIQEEEFLCCQPYLPKGQHFDPLLMSLQVSQSLSLPMKLMNLNLVHHYALLFRLFA